MSGQPTQTPLDPAKFRQQYLANLKLQSDINEQNYQANRVFKMTGIPQQPTDTRNTTEKLADIERLKIEIRSALREITGGQEANKIVQTLSPTQIQFTAQALPRIIADLKPKYRLGVPADIFITYLNRFMDAEVRTRGVEDGLQQASGDQILLNTQLILQQMANQEDLARLVDKIDQIGLGGNALRRDVMRIIRILRDELPTREELANLADDNYIQNIQIKQEIQELLNSALREVPSKAQIEQLQMRLEDFAQMRDVDGVNEVLRQIGDLTDISIDIEEELEIVKQLAQQAISQAGSAGSTPPPVRSPYIPPDSIGAKPSKTELIRYLQLIESEGGGDLFPRGATPTSWGKRPKDAIVAFLRDNDARIKTIFNVITATSVVATPVKDTAGGAEMEGKGMKGRGIGRPKTRNALGSTRPHRADIITPDDIDFSTGVPVAPRFIPFGKLILNRNQLAKNIVSVKTIGGGFVKEFLSKKVSHNMGEVLRKIGCGAIPSFDDFDSLDKDERIYLHKLASKASILDRISVPTPKIDEDEKDINQFNIMKGQILAGNDNADMVKKFKVLILKLVRRGMLPKNEANNILMDLTTLGH